MPRVPRFKIGALEQLYRELRYAPPEARRRQMEAAERLVDEIDPGQVYPWEFVVFRITAYRPDGDGPPVALVGEAVRSDLVTLIQRLSRGLEIKADQGGRHALRLEEVARRLNVSAKTLQRLRQRGLVCHSVVFPDGVRRVACFEDALEHFAARHRKRLDRASSFSRVEDSVQQSVIREAREQRRTRGVTLNTAARRLAEKYGRAPETLRSILHRHDRRSAEPIFDDTAPLSARDIRVIHRAAHWGVSPGELARRFRKTPSTIHRAVNRRRGDLLRGLELNARGDGASDALGSSLATASLPALLEHDEALALIEAARRIEPAPDAVERVLARAYNALKTRARDAIEALPENPPAGRLDAVETDLRRAAMIKRRLVELNLSSALEIMERMFERRIVEQPSEKIRDLLRLAIGVVSATVDEFDPDGRARLADACAAATTETLASRHLQPPTRRAARRHAPGSVAFESPFETICPWQPWLAPRPDLAARLEQLEPALRAIVELRYGLRDERPLTLAEIAERTGTTASSVARRIAVGERELRKVRAAEVTGDE